MKRPHLTFLERIIFKSGTTQGEILKFRLACTKFKREVYNELMTIKLFKLIFKNHE